MFAQVRAGSEEVPLNLGTEKINLNTPCGAYVENSGLGRRDANAPGSSSGGSNEELYLRLFGLIFLNLLSRIIINN